MQNEQQIETPEPDEQQLPPAEPPVVEDISEKLKPTTHDYVQFGSELVCQSPGHNHRHQISPTKTLVRGRDGGYGFIRA